MKNRYEIYKNKRSMNTSRTLLGIKWPLRIWYAVKINLFSINISRSLLAIKWPLTTSYADKIKQFSMNTNPLLLGIKWPLTTWYAVKIKQFLMTPLYTMRSLFWVRCLLVNRRLWRPFVMVKHFIKSKNKNATISWKCSSWRMTSFGGKYRM